MLPTHILTTQSETKGCYIIMEGTIILVEIGASSKASELSIITEDKTYELFE